MSLLKNKRSLFQVIERNLLLVMVIMLEDVQSKPVVCVQFFLWNVLDLLRYALLSSVQGISLQFVRALNTWQA